MRNEYITNFVEQMVGQGLMKGISAQAYTFQSAWDLRKLLEPVIRPKLEPMTAETLGRIIEYSDVVHRQSRWEAYGLIGKEHLINRENLTAQTEVGVYATYGGKQLLVHLAMLTVLAVVFDVINQRDYQEIQGFDREDPAFW